MCRFSILMSFLMVFFYQFAAVTLGFPGEEAASVGIYVKDIKTGEVLASNDPEKALVPASVMKSLTAATALSSLDHNFRFETKVYLSGEVANGICSGNIIIESVADPTIDSELFRKNHDKFSNEISKALSQLGVSEIKGKVIIHQSLSDSGCIPNWEIDDVAWAYGAGLFGFNFNDNVFSLWPASGKTSPYIPGLTVTVVKDEASNLVRGIDSNHIYAFGPRPTNEKWTVRTSMSDPASAFAHQLKEVLKSNGIRVIGKDIPKDESLSLVCTHLSPTLPDILNQMLIESHNLFAEGMLRALAPGASRKRAIEKQQKIWSDRGVTGYNKVLDGSGLARADRLQPLFLAKMFEWMAKSRFSSSYVSLFPKAGVEGTVRGLLSTTPLKGKLVLKSGSMNAVQCYAGYKIDESGAPTHVVVILVNGFYCERSTLKKSIEKFLTNTFK